MNFVLAIVIGFLFSSGVFLLIRRSLVKLIIGLVLLGHGANLLIFTVGRANGTLNKTPPIIPKDEHVLTGMFADPLPQALVLTAIVIGFGVLAFTLMLVRETASAAETGDVAQIHLTDGPSH